MILLSRLKEELKKRLTNLKYGEILEVLTYKKDRGFLIVLGFDGKFTLKEFGYKTTFYQELTSEELLKKLDKIIQTEFPRSEQARLYHHLDDKNLINTRRYF